MATRKQRARRAKTFRHEYGFVTYDEEGNEVEVSGAELRGRTPDGEKAEGEKAQAKEPAKSGAAKPAPRGTPQPPSWERALKRGGLTGLGLALVLTFLLHGPIVIALVYGVMFIPLTYWMDGLSYRWYQKRQNAAAEKKQADKRPGARSQAGGRKGR